MSARAGGRRESRWPLRCPSVRSRFSRRSAASATFLERFAAELPNVEVVWGRAEEQPVDGYGVALAKALAKPPVAIELCLPLVTSGGVAVLWVGRDVDLDPVRRVAERLGGSIESDLDGLAVVRKLTATPAGFPRRPGMAKKRPLA